VFEEADKGTLFLDEIGELAPELQVKLLRALDRREVARIGEPTHYRKVDVRVIAATHRDLRRMVAAGHFREDLYFRLAQAIVELPPLRARGDDIEALAREFLQRIVKEHGIVRELGNDVIPVLRAYHWPGNVRELKHVIAHAARNHFRSRGLRRPQPDHPHGHPPNSGNEQTPPGHRFSTTPVNKNCAAC
jgi:transcriptional regulator with GAF, ATPase, and Fis domain